MKRFFRLLSCAALAIACCSATAFCQTGIKPDVHFKLPFSVDGKDAIHRAIVVVAGDGEATLVVDYVKGEEILTAKYTLTRQDDPDPDPTPPTPDPEPVDQKYMVCFFVESNTLDDGDLTQDQVDMLVGLKFRQDLKSKGHNFVGAFDENNLSKWSASCRTGKCKTQDNPWTPFFKEAAKYTGPRVVVTAVGSGKYKCVKLPKTIDEFYKLIGGGE